MYAAAERGRDFIELRESQKRFKTQQRENRERGDGRSAKAKALSAALDLWKC
jgi:hypothetical protein